MTRERYVRGSWVLASGEAIIVTSGLEYSDNQHRIAIAINRSCLKNDKDINTDRIQHAKLILHFQCLC
jgi:hypothetical protein